jgi:hypothetical protein
MGLEKVPCIRLDHLTDTQRRDYAIRHNRTAELSGWDFAKLEEEIAALEIEGVDLSGLKLLGQEMEFPETLDAEKDEDERIYVKLIFDDYDHFQKHEDETKAFAESVGAEFGLVKG